MAYHLEFRGAVLICLEPIICVEPVVDRGTVRQPDEHILRSTAADCWKVAIFSSTRVWMSTSLMMGKAAVVVIYSYGTLMTWKFNQRLVYERSHHNLLLNFRCV
jgi:hypothetical protein